MNRLTLLSLSWMALGLGLASGEAPRKPDVPKLVKDLEAKDAKERVAACEALLALARSGSAEARKALGPLLKVVGKDADAAVRAAAATVLGRMDGAAERVVPALMDRLKNDKDHAVVLACLNSLGAFATEAKDSLPLLSELLTKSRADYAEAEKARLKAKKAGNQDQEKLAETRMQEAKETEQTILGVRAVVLDNR